MPKNSTFSHYKISSTSLPDKKTLDISTFRGLDLNSAQFNVAEYHAIAMKNIVWKDKVNQKRNGFEQVAQVPTVEYYIEAGGEKINNENNKRINGVYNFFGEDKKFHTIVHSGNLLFEVTNFGKDYTFTEAKWELVCKKTTIDGITYIVCKEIKNDISRGFCSNNRLFLLDGVKYRVIRSKLSNITIVDVENDEGTYVPTTTIGIGMVWKAKNDNGEYVDYSIQSPTPLDDVNMLTQWRKNKIISGQYVGSENSYKDDFYSYQLDTSIRPKEKLDINNIEISITTLEE